MVGAVSLANKDVAAISSGVMMVVVGAVVGARVGARVVGLVVGGVVGAAVVGGMVGAAVATGAAHMMNSHQSVVITSSICITDSDPYL